MIAEVDAGIAGEAWHPYDEGTFYQLPAETYHAAPGVSHSMLRHMHPTPAHLKAYLAEPWEPTPVMILGTLAHHLLLEPEKPMPKVAVKPAGMSFATREGKAWRAEQGGKLIVGADAWESLHGMVRSVSTHPAARQMLTSCSTEVSVFKTLDLFDGGTVLRKARMDIVPAANVLCDIKTCDDASAPEFGKKLADGYATQAAYYLDIWNDANPDDQRDGFVFLAVERRAPYLTAAYIVSRESIEWAREINRVRLSRFLICDTENRWPGYPDEFVPISVPDWAMRKL